MITANDALQITNKVLLPETERVLSDIEEKIREAAEQGDSRIEYSLKEVKVDTEKLKDELRKARFSADIGASRVCVITWNK